MTEQYHAGGGWTPPTSNLTKTDANEVVVEQAEHIKDLELQVEGLSQEFAALQKAIFKAVCALRDLRDVVDSSDQRVLDIIDTLES